MAVRRQLCFLIGAHKTASTHLQRSVTRSKAALAQTGVAAIGPVPIGADLLPLADLLRGRTDPDLLRLAAEGFLQREAKDLPRALLMNENILGASLAPRMLLQDDRLYKFAPGRLKRLLQLFPDHELSVGIAIRAPSSFLISAWQEDMKGHAFGPFRDYLGNIDPGALSWLALIKRLRQAAGDIPFFVWRYEDYPAVAPQVLGHCLGDSAGAVHLLEGTANPGFSAAALDHLADLGAVTKDNTIEALRRFPKGPDYPAFTPWSESELQAASARYAQDCDDLTDLDGVTLITT